MASQQVELEQILGFAPKRRELYLLALTHRSFVNEYKGAAPCQGGKAQHNERLELLGDSVLGLCITEHLYQSFPQRNEGVLSKLKSYIVSAESLAAAAREYQLGHLILLGKGESRDGGEDKDSILANVVEALIGACYLDQGLAQARHLVLRLLGSQLARYRDCPYSPQDAKLRLQEYVQKLYKSLPRYDTNELFAPPCGGAVHTKNEKALRPCGFESRLYINERYICNGTGPSKKQAEKQAALVAWQQIEQGLPGEADGRRAMQALPLFDEKLQGTSQ